jgi:AraC-like DNA-binding protein
VWSEAIEGTNGIGTCIAEERSVTVHGNQHFRSRHTDLSCFAAPVFGVDGSLMAVLDVSAIDPERSERAHALTGALTANSARAIEERFFQERFRQGWIVAMAPPEEGDTGMLLALGIVGANRTARTSMLLDDHRLRTGVSLWNIFERDPRLSRRKDVADIPTQLIVAGSDETWPALVTPPESGRAAWQQARSDALHTRPRLDSLANLRQRAPASPARGGLPPGAMRRVREHVEAHLSESMDLAELAAIAGLSVYHFARAFKQSAGVTPHHYLVHRRIERAQEMLARSELPLSGSHWPQAFRPKSLGASFPSDARHPRTVPLVTTLALPAQQARSNDFSRRAVPRCRLPSLPRERKRVKVGAGRRPRALRLK